jgi:hypothetical protein
MFEAVQEKKEASSSRLHIGIAVVLAAAIAGAAVYMLSRGNSKSPQSAATSAAPAAATAQAAADWVHDLKIFKATMDKDTTGTTAVWTVVIENRSSAYTYSNIQYETAYIGADNHPLLLNTGTISASLDPGDSKTSQFRDALYPVRTSWYKFRITGASAKIQ